MTNFDDNRKSNQGAEGKIPLIVTTRVKMSFGKGAELPEEFVAMTDSADQIGDGSLVFGMDEVGQEPAAQLTDNMQAQLDKIEAQPERQDGMQEQLKDLKAFAAKLGMLKAVEFLNTWGNHR